MEKERGIVIVGCGNHGLTALRMAEIKAAHPDLEVVTIEEAKERGLHQSYELKAPPPMPEIIIPVTPFHQTGISNRAARRKQERQARKRK